MPHYHLREYPLQQGALEIAYIEEFFNEFPKRKTANEIMSRLEDRERQILMAEAPLDDGTVVPVSYKVSHELREHETDPALADLVERLKGSVVFTGRRILYNWLGATRRDWRGRGHFRALTEEQEAWGINLRFSAVRSGAADHACQRYSQGLSADGWPAIQSRPDCTQAT